MQAAKNNTPPRIFFMFSKLYIWYQIEQSVSYWNGGWSGQLFSYQFSLLFKSMFSSFYSNYCRIPGTTEIKGKIGMKRVWINANKTSHRKQVPLYNYLETTCRNHISNICCKTNNEEHRKKYQWIVDFRTRITNLEYLRISNIKT